MTMFLWTQVKQIYLLRFCTAYMIYFFDNSIACFFRVAFNFTNTKCHKQHNNKSLCKDFDLNIVLITFFGHKYNIIQQIILLLRNFGRVKCKDIVWYKVVALKLIKNRVITQKWL